MIRASRYQLLALAGFALTQAGNALAASYDYYATGQAQGASATATIP